MYDDSLLFPFLQLSSETRLEWRQCTKAIHMSAKQACVVVIGENIYVGGGNGSGLTYPIGHSVLKYSISYNSWSELPPCPVSDFGMAQFKKRLITVGGKKIPFYRKYTDFERRLPTMGNVLPTNANCKAMPVSHHYSHCHQSSRGILTGVQSRHSRR